MREIKQGATVFLSVSALSTSRNSGSPRGLRTAKSANGSGSTIGFLGVRPMPAITAGA